MKSPCTHGIITNWILSATERNQRELKRLGGGRSSMTITCPQCKTNHRLEFRSDGGIKHRPEMAEDEDRGQDPRSNP